MATNNVQVQASRCHRLRQWNTILQYHSHKLFSQIWSTNKVFLVHPQANGQVDLENQMILKWIKKKLNDTKGLWAKLFHEILWSYQTTPHSSNKATPFIMYKVQMQHFPRDRHAFMMAFLVKLESEWVKDKVFHQINRWSKRSRPHAGVHHFAFSPFCLILPLLHFLPISYSNLNTINWKWLKKMEMLIKITWL